MANELGLMLPCNVTVETSGKQGCLVHLANPGAMLQAANQPDTPALQELATEATARMKRVAAALQS